MQLADTCCSHDNCKISATKSYNSVTEKVIIQSPSVIEKVINQSSERSNNKRIYTKISAIEKNINRSPEQSNNKRIYMKDIGHRKGYKSVTRQENYTKDHPSVTTKVEISRYPRGHSEFRVPIASRHCARPSDHVHVQHVCKNRKLTAGSTVV